MRDGTTPNATFSLSITSLSLGLEFIEVQEWRMMTEGRSVLYVGMEKCDKIGWDDWKMKMLFRRDWTFKEYFKRSSRMSNDCEKRQLDRSREYWMFS